MHMQNITPQPRSGSLYISVTGERGVDSGYVICAYIFPLCHSKSQEILKFCSFGYILQLFYIILHLGTGRCATLVSYVWCIPTLFPLYTLYSHQICDVSKSHQLIRIWVDYTHMAYIHTYTHNTKARAIGPYIYMACYAFTKHEWWAVICDIRHLQSNSSGLRMQPSHS